MTGEPNVAAAEFRWTPEVTKALGDPRSAEYVRLLGRYNDAPPNWRAIEPDDFWRKFHLHGTGVVEEFRQIGRIQLGGPTLLDVHLFVYADGTGLAVHVQYAFVSGKTTWTPAFYAFAICEHERVATADTRYGWHEGHCRKCGRAMNYDTSG